MKAGAKRFYTQVDTKAVATGFAVLLDGKAIKTPAGQVQTAPTKALAEAIAQEWREQAEEIDIHSLVLTKALNTSLDRVSSHREDIIEELANYAGCDLLCYRAEAPAELVRRQSLHWDRWLDWAAKKFGISLTVVSGLNHAQQPSKTLATIKSAIAAHNTFELTALHSGVTITGSAVLGLAFTVGAISADEAFEISQIDETFQAERWGRDAEAEVARSRRLEDLRTARRYLDLLLP